MTTEPTIEEKALAAQGVKPADLNPGHVGGGNKVPDEPSNKKPVVEPTAEEKAAKEKTDKEAADKLAAEEAAKKTDDKKVDDEVGVTKWVELNDEAGDAVIGLLQDAGVTPLEGNAIFQKAVASGDLADVDWAALEKKLPAGKFLLAKAGVEKYYADKYAPIQATVAKAYEITGSEQNWNTIKEWAHKQEKADPAFKATLDDVRKGIAQNGWIAEKSIERLKGLYEAAPGNKGLNVTKLVQGDTTAAPTGDALSRDDYMKEMRALHNGLKQPDARKVADLRARRQAGMKAGI